MRRMRYPSNSGTTFIIPANSLASRGEGIPNAIEDTIVEIARKALLPAEAAMHPPGDSKAWDRSWRAGAGRRRCHDLSLLSSQDDT